MTGVSGLPATDRLVILVLGRFPGEQQGEAIKHGKVALTLHFNSVQLPDGTTLPIDAHLAEVENTRESVTTNGTIKGTRSTATLGYSAENKTALLAQIDPIGYIFTSSAGPTVLGFAEQEILYPTGTEMQVALDRPLLTAKSDPTKEPPLHWNAQQAEQWNALVLGLPFRTRTATSHVTSEITNLIFLGTSDALHRAFAAAGWSSTDSLTAATFQMTCPHSFNHSQLEFLLVDDGCGFRRERGHDPLSLRASGGTPGGGVR